MLHLRQLVVGPDEWVECCWVAMTVLCGCSRFDFNGCRFYFTSADEHSNEYNFVIISRFPELVNGEVLKSPQPEIRWFSVDELIEELTGY